MSDSDVEGVEFVAMPTTTQVYITGNVVSDQQHFQTLKVRVTHSLTVADHLWHNTNSVLPEHTAQAHFYCVQNTPWIAYSSEQRT